MSEDNLISRINPLAHEPEIVHECMRDKMFYLNGLCMATTFYSCRHQNKLAKPTLVGERPCYECALHNKPVVNTIIDWINLYGFGKKGEEKKVNGNEGESI